MQITVIRYYLGNHDKKKMVCICSVLMQFFPPEYLLPVVCWIHGYGAWGYRPTILSLEICWRGDSVEEYIQGCNSHLLLPTTSQESIAVGRWGWEWALVGKAICFPQDSGEREREQWPEDCVEPRACGVAETHINQTRTPGEGFHHRNNGDAGDRACDPGLERANSVNDIRLYERAFWGLASISW